MDLEREEKPTDRWRLELRTELASLPNELEGFLSALRVIREGFYRETAKALQTRLNEHFRARPQFSYEDKREIALWLGQVLRETGLAVRCQKTLRPGRIIAGYRDDSQRDSRFQLEVTDSDGRVRRTLTATELPELELQKAPPREESLARRPSRSV